MDNGYEVAGLRDGLRQCKVESYTDVSLNSIFRSCPYISITCEATPVCETAAV